MQKESFIKIRCTPEEKANWCALASQLGLTLTEWVKDKLNEEKPIESPARRVSKTVVTKPSNRQKTVPGKTKAHHPACKCAICILD